MLWQDIMGLLVQVGFTQYRVIVSDFLAPILRYAKVDGMGPDENQALRTTPRRSCCFIDLQLLSPYDCK